MLLCYAFQNLYAFYEDVIIYGRRHTRKRQINLTKVLVLVSKSHFKGYWTMYIYCRRLIVTDFQLLLTCYCYLSRYYDIDIGVLLLAGGGRDKLRDFHTTTGAALLHFCFRR